MANKFTKSILERQLHQPALPQEPAPLPAVPSAKPIEEDSPKLYTNPPEEKAAKPAPERHPTAKSTAAPANTPYQMPEGLADLLTPTPQRSAKNKTFYLDAQVIDAIKTVAKKQKITESRLVNDLLRKVLGV